MRILTAIALTILCLSGCSDKTIPSSSSASSTSEDKAVASTTTDTDAASADSQKSAASAGLANEVELTLADYAKLESAVRSYNGRVVVLDIWSTSCVPCMKEFPHLVELARRWPEDVVCISLNVDYAGLPNKPAESYLPKAKNFLVSVSADPSNMMNLLSNEGDEDMLARFAVDAMPAILIFDRKGNLAKKVTDNTAGDNGLTYADDVVPEVEKLIESK